MSECNQLCNQGRICTCLEAQKPGYEYAAPEGGNVLLTEHEAQEPSPWESIAMWLGVSLFGLLNVALIAGACGWIYQSLQ